MVEHRLAAGSRVYDAQISLSTSPNAMDGGDIKAARVCIF